MTTRAQYILHIFEDDAVKAQLQSYVNYDENIAKQWVKHTGGNEDPQHLAHAKKTWVKSNPQFSHDDLFGRKEWGPKAKRHILQHKSEILSDHGADWSKPSKTLLAWHIVHHMDHDVPFQKHMLGEFKKHGFNNPTHPNNRQYQFLDDRVHVNTGKKEKYGTQAGTHINPE